MRRMLPYLFLIPTLATSYLWWRAEQGRFAAIDDLLRLQSHQLSPGLLRPSAAPPVAAPPVNPAGTAPETRVVRIPTATDTLSYLRLIDELREQAKERAKELSAARDATARAEAALASEGAEGKKLRAQLEELRDDLQAARRLADALQVELRAKSERVSKAETAEKIGQERMARAEASLAKVAVASKEIADLHRRRETLLTALLRRYREVNDLYRNFALDAQTRESSGGGLQAGDLSRIQSAIQQAEDDLRQVQALNARMAQLAKAQ